MKTLLASALSLVLFVLLAASPACSSSGKTACVDGSACGSGKLQSCAVSDSSGACASGYYKAPDGKIFNWASCNDQAAAATAVQTHCAASGGDASTASDAATGTDAAPETDAATETDATAE